MKKIIYLLVLNLAACGTPSAPDFSGSWRAVNTYTDNVQEIPLRQVHIYKASPIDQTLMALLRRWARESNNRLDYQHPSDFTLHTAVAKIQHQNLVEAITKLNAIYAKYGVTVELTGDNVLRVTSPLSKEDAKTLAEKAGADVTPLKLIVSQPIPAVEPEPVVSSIHELGDPLALFVPIPEAEPPIAATKEKK